MTPENKPGFVTLLANIWSSVYEKKISTLTLDVYWKVLDRFSFQAVEKAIYKHVNDPDRGRFVPKPADLIHQLESGFQPLLAWTKVSQAIKCYGAYESIVFDDPFIHTVISDMGGWIRVCLEPEGTLPFYQREFERRYQHACRHPPDKYPRELIGHINHYNQRFGRTLTPPRFFGDRTGVLQVYAQGIEPTQLIQHCSGVLSVKQLAVTSSFPEQAPQPSLLNLASTDAASFINSLYAVESDHEKN